MHKLIMLTLSTWACEACNKVPSTISKYFVKFVPIAKAMSPNTDKIWGLTVLWTLLSWKQQSKVLLIVPVLWSER